MIIAINFGASFRNLHARQYNRHSLDLNDPMLLYILREWSGEWRVGGCEWGGVFA